MGSWCGRDGLFAFLLLVAPLMFAAVAVQAGGSGAPDGGLCVRGLSALQGVAVDLETGLERLRQLNRTELLRVAEEMLRDRCGAAGTVVRGAEGSRRRKSTGTSGAARTAGGSNKYVGVRDSLRRNRFSSHSAAASRHGPVSRPLPPRRRSTGPACGSVRQNRSLTDAERAEWEALARLFNETGGPYWTTSECWNVSLPTLVCDGGGSSWHGVHCANGSVVGLDLTANNVAGSVQFLANWTGLTQLSGLWLDWNRLSGPVVTSLAGLPNLRTLSLGNNVLQSSLSGSFEGFGLVNYLHLGGNFLGGTFPAAWSGLGQLQKLDLSGNGLSGTFPGISGLPHLLNLTVTGNRLQGGVPSNWSSVPQLGFLDLSSNLLSGELPSLWYGADLLFHLDVSNNELEGSFPLEWSGVPLLQALHCSSNLMSGPVPTACSGLNRLTSLQVEGNLFHGTVPADWGRLPSLQYLSLAQNHLSGVVPANWSAPQLISVDLSHNRLSGTLPGTWSGLEQLSVLILVGNQLSGTIPSTWTGLPALNELAIGTNRISGVLPSTWFGLPDLALLETDANRLSGAFPVNWTGTDKLSSIYLSQNKLSGTVPSTVTGLGALQFLDLSANNISGALPSDWHGWGSLLFLNLAVNFVTSLPTTMSGIGSLATLFLFANNLEGTVPCEFQGFEGVINLQLSFNSLSGTLCSSWRGLPSVVLLDLSGNSISGTVPSVFYGLDRLGQLSVNDNQLSGPVPEAFEGLPFLSLLYLSKNQLSGTLPALPLGGLGSLTVLTLDSNELSGSLRTTGAPGSSPLQILFLSVNLLEGSIAPSFWAAHPDLAYVDISINTALGGSLAWDAGFSASLTEFRAAFCNFSGQLPDVFSLPSCSYVDLSGNLFDSFEDDAGALQQPRPPDSALGALRTLRLAGNRISALPAAFCDLAPRLTVLDVGENALRGLQACLGNLTGLRILDASRNPFENGLPNPLLGPGSQIESLKLGGTNLTATDLVSLGSSPALLDIDLSDNDLDLEVDSVLELLTDAFPSVTGVGLANTSIRSYMGSTRVSQLERLNLNSNPQFFGFAYGRTLDNEYGTSVTRRPVDEEIPRLSGLSLDGATLVYPVLSYPSALETLDQADVVLGDDCLPFDLLLSHSLRSVDISRSHFSGTAEPGGRGAQCRRRTLRLVTASASQRRFFSESGLTCPQWLTAKSGAAIVADANYLRFEMCRCAESQFFDAVSRTCRMCPFTTLDGLVCDPFVLLPRHVLNGNVYPVLNSAATDPGGRTLPEFQADLTHSSIVRCRRPGLCNVEPRPTSVDLNPQSHSDAAVVAAGGVDPPLSFSCASGHDPTSLMCSRCSRDYWLRSDGFCTHCNAAALLVAVLVVGLVCAVAAWYYWYGRQSTDSGWRTLSVALLWFQLQGLLKAPVLFYVGSGAVGSNNPLGFVSDFLRTYALLEPGSLVCLAADPRPNFIRESFLVLVAPAVALAVFAAVVWTASRLSAGPDLRARLVALAAQVQLALFLPVTARAVQVMKCEHLALPSGLLSFLSAVPYVDCGDSSLVPLRVLAGLVLVLYSLPLPAVASRWILLRLSGRSSRGSGSRVPLVPSLATAAAGSVETVDRAPLLDPDDPEMSADRERQVESAGESPDSGDAAVSFAVDYRNPVDLVFLVPLRDPAGFWWWWVLEIVLKWVIVLLVGLLPVTSPAVAAGVGVTSLVFFQVHLHYQPWRHRLDNVAETAVLAVVAATFFLVVGLVVMDGGTPGDATLQFAQVFVTFSETAMFVLLFLCVFFKSRIENRLLNRSRGDHLARRRE